MLSLLPESMLDVIMLNVTKNRTEKFVEDQLEMLQTQGCYREVTGTNCILLMSNTQRWT